ncbi:hypothetical protein IM543_20165 [Massilia sp. UMI-21]|nr:hypothetical protein IM543_20165 [Massilia sp. UMI-21]
MMTHSFRPDGKAQGRRQMRDEGRDGGVPAHHAELAAVAERLTQDQMLVNQALVEKIFACERAEAALRESERKLHDLLAHQLAHREAERKRMSEEIHDAVGQNLLALRMDIVMLHQHTGQRFPRLHEWVGAALDNVDITLRTVKHLLGELRPAGLELGLAATLEMETRKFTRNSGIACQLELDSAIGKLELDEEILLTLCRGVQECLNNVFRHSLASRVALRLHLERDMLAMSVRDNGIGFDTTAARRPSCYGLLGLEERLSAQGGELAIASERSRGTTVTMRVPAAPPRQGPAPPRDAIE